MSIFADLTFRALITAVDDYGRLDARPHKLKADLFPVRPSVATSEVVEWVEELCCEGCVELYEVDGRRYLRLTGWEKHRGNSNRAKKSKYPSPEDGCVIYLNPPEIREILGDPSESRESRVGGIESGGEGEFEGEGLKPKTRGKRAPRKPPVTASTWKLDGTYRLTDAEVQSLRAARPDFATADEVQAWFRLKAPKMVAAGRRDLGRTAVAWWTIVDASELSQARDELHRIERNAVKAEVDRALQEAPT